MNTNTELTQRRTAAMPRGIGVLSHFHAAQADNALLTDAEGRQYIDFAAGIAVLNTGHRHPRVVGAIRQQLLRFTHTAFQVVPYENAIALAERLNALAPVAKPAKTALFTTGVEAVENAVKIARYATGRSALIAFSGAFHGRTLLGLSLTGKVVPYKAGFGSMLPEVYHLPFPAPTLGVGVNDTLNALTRLFKADVDPQRVAAIVIEPVQGEGGFYPAPPALLEALRAQCDAHGILLIADEVQSGFGRTGRWFAMEHHGVQADLICMAKSLGGGMPLSGVTGRAEVMDAPPPGALGSTYAANPLSVAAAHAVLDIIDEQQLCARAEHLGARLMARLRALQERDAGMAEVRGLGSMVAVEFSQPGSHAPDAERVNGVVQAAMSQGLLLLPCGVHGNVLRFLYPLTIEEALFERALDILDKVLGRD
ncbi:4-aminobutyrate--2-oxoglutarate transaminase [Comamonas endophytica]|uniref:4-aminobutyrate--2-oxoglutarate transaminase n=1 Tax=Comamonas endophytica TaxID=2949090 RepID=A0ABY6GC97_9BURK|nr:MULTISPECIES: 4-aminobutyrate--2-oxoglutarate transaminase [unclassified Acidovorax]MCD2512214.1 4-aminobutyrate--2-oxoglutarate transaminase [Acidovorax sp. D4N7]UYG51982.1 4-aminobutyrate--2-oxoglutarate transaminase [Acidovorax sp. 5MLIR]